MHTKLILTDLRAQRDRVDQAIAALESLGGILTAAAPPASAANPSTAKSKRYISPEGRARIIAATKARWARQRAGKPAGRNVKKDAKPAAKKATAGARTMSPVARKRIAEGMRKRWAEKKKAKA
jgi:hypothetical protein